MKKWTLNSWRNYPVKHIPEYENKKELNMVLDKIRNFPPLVFAGETRTLKNHLADVVDGKAFLLQGGDCAESFTGFNPNNIRDLFKVILQMSVVLTFGASCPVVKVGRIAGQFAKPRSQETENKEGVIFESYKGDIINDIKFDVNLREPNPNRLIQAYNQSASTLNLLRAFSQGGFANLKKIHQWNIDIVHTSTALTFQGAIAAKLTNKPHIWHIRENIGNNGQYKFWVPDFILIKIFNYLSNFIALESKFAGEIFFQTDKK